ncbi:prolipoprotein diacylglyceryl transferase [Ornithinimicrobium cavernae]|uniref:prolipoprotein diacylglyceryl transferase n=1 Tax=Ornithinimicrobium cavernae TaxID=2666047 RepID=UPI000D69E905|nr:prolipoprotein diacylglyceryl transferase family protein [Ornithinimicrobium cavernae]
MYPTLGDLLGTDLPIGTHEFFVALGVLAALAVLGVRLWRTGAGRDERMLYIVAGALVGGAVFMRLGTWLQDTDLRQNATLVEQWLYGNRSILGGLVGAWLGVHLAKRLSGYRTRTGDLFVPAVALGMAVGRWGCHLTELPGTPSRLGLGPVLDSATAERLGGIAGVPLHPSLLYEAAFHTVAFAVICWSLSRRRLPQGETFVLYIASYAVFRLLVEFVRGNEVVWMGLSRPQLFLLVLVPLVLARIAWQARRGVYSRQEAGNVVLDQNGAGRTDERSPVRASTAEGTAP